MIITVSFKRLIYFYFMYMCVLHAHLCMCKVHTVLVETQKGQQIVVSLHLGPRNQSRSLEELSVISAAEPSLQPIITASLSHSMSDQVENERGKRELGRGKRQYKGWRRQVERKNEVGKIIFLFLCLVIQTYTWNCLLIVWLDLREKQVKHRSWPKLPQSLFGKQIFINKLRSAVKQIKIFQPFGSSENSNKPMEPNNP